MKTIKNLTIILSLTLIMIFASCEKEPVNEYEYIHDTIVQIDTVCNNTDKIFKDSFSYVMPLLISNNEMAFLKITNKGTLNCFIEIERYIINSDSINNKIKVQVSNVFKTKGVPTSYYTDLITFDNYEFNNSHLLLNLFNVNDKNYNQGLIGTINVNNVNKDNFDGQLILNFNDYEFKIDGTFYNETNMSSFKESYITLLNKGEYKELSEKYLYQLLDEFLYQLNN